ncbi:MAG: hypothetical protein ACOYMR_12850 [Ilumatobacteraceae bacterium]
MLPLRPLRAALLAFIGALVMVEAGSGLVAGEAWRQQSSGALSAERLTELHDMLVNLRRLEDLVVFGILAITIVWSVLALHNATLIAHGSRTIGVLALAALFAGPMLFLVVRAAEPSGGTGRLINVGLQVLALYLPFWGLGHAADGIGGTRLTFFRWYLALAASFLLHTLFTSRLDVLGEHGVDNLGRTTMMFFINALIVTVMGVMAAEATRGMDRSIVERALQRRLLRDDASLRTRGSGGSGDAGPSLPPPTPGGTPVTTTGPGGSVAVLEAPKVALTEAVLAPPTEAPVIPGPTAGPMPLPTLAAVRPPSAGLDAVTPPPAAAPVAVPDVVTPAIAIPVVVVSEPLTPIESPALAAREVASPVSEPVLVTPTPTLPKAFQPLVLEEPVFEEPVLEAPIVEMPVVPMIEQPEPALVRPAAVLPPPVPSPLPPPPPGSRSSLPKLLTITEMRPIPVVELEPEPDDEPQPVVEEAAPEPVSGFSSMFQPLSLRKP